ncbi:MAG: hypothetical protein WA007_14980 [Hydrogenophaga sp.]
MGPRLPKPYMLTLIASVKLIAEIALLALFGQWVLGLLAGQKKDKNLFYQLLQQIGRPFVVLARWVSPRFVLERHHPLVAFLILGFVWILATAAKISHCLKIGVQLCQ